ncbi:MAG TPA: alanine--tRNA ligase [Actinomycetota bacterium]|nr:alanine--tRNA ligase [Actinomycetota bacterium]
MDGATIRETFLRFFEERGHKRVPSSPLIPPPESGLLLTNAGMNQFIPYFLGHAPAPFPRATSTQKCFRANDIENVGRTARHLTFFEMLGNFSFGDYFKRESCGWGFELVTEVFGIDPDRLWVTVFRTDDEAAEIWLDIGIPAERIVRRGAEDNYWWTHAAGPAGPCSEIYVDRGSRYGTEGGPEVDEERYLEIWNHVFMQEEVDERMQVVGDLPAKNIDTGSSLERVAVVLQGVDSVFETDLFRPLLEVAEALAGIRHGDDPRADMSLKVVAEHGRATTFLIADGVQPSNEGRGYVLRRMLRRVVSHARRLGIETPVMERLVEVTVQRFGQAFPELVENQAYVAQVAASEEERFAGTLRQGMVVVEEEVQRTPAGGTVSGDVVFKLHDTFGFPKELTRELVEDSGLSVDEGRFEELMTEQRERAKRAAKRARAGDELAGVSGPTEFVGYGSLESDGRLLAVLADGVRAELAGEGQEVRLVLDRTPFYAESGGQIGDHGYLRTPGGLIRVVDAQYGPGNVIVHSGVVLSGEVREGDEGHAEVDAMRRAATARAHTATHIVHWTLRHVLGEHARQAGSLVAPGRLRFDFPHHAAVPRDVLEQAEEIANQRLSEDAPVTVYETTFEEAKSQGAIALFGEKYGEFVRVVEVGDYSVELCGGTHVRRAGNVGVVRILGESSIGAGMRRVEALVGPDALKEVNSERQLLQDVLDALGVGDRHTAPERVRELLEQNRRLSSELGKIRKQDVAARAQEVAGRAVDVAGARLVVSAEVGSAEELRELAQAAVGRLEGSGGAAVVLGSGAGGRALVVAACTKELVSRGVNAKQLLEPAARAVGGGAGGKPVLGTAGGPKGEALDEALGLIPARLEELAAGHEYGSDRRGP